MTKQKRAIILTDGGFCSQIAFYVLAKHLEEKGYEVKFDLSWFKNNGMDLNNVFTRDYVIDKAFSNLKFEIATEDEIKKLKKHHIHIDGFKYLEKLLPEMYISGYPEERTQLIGKYKDYLINNFNPVDKDEVENIVKEVQNCNSCAVHVRRGDLSNYAQGYGSPCDKEYFLKAMDIIASLKKDPVFYFFSEEPEWIKENIFPYTKYNCKLIDKNNSSKGYLDLYIMSNCKSVIASQGSFGNFAKVLSKNEDMLLITPYFRDYISNNFKNVIVFNTQFQKEPNMVIEFMQKRLKKYKKQLKLSLILSVIFALLSVILTITLAGILWK